MSTRVIAELKMQNAKLKQKLARIALKVDRISNRADFFRLLLENRCIVL
jgi:hypothetical protein